MKTRAIEVHQNGFVFYICSLDVKLLSKISSTSMEKIENNTDVFQRQLSLERQKRITSFSNRTQAMFPTAIVLNSKNDIDYKDGNIEINEEPDSYFIIDGQHRIFGIKDSNYDYELCVVIVKVDRDKQSELFITINTEAKTVNSNVRFNMKSNDAVGTPEKEIRNIAVRLNGDELSPFYNKIWLDDKPRKRENVKLSLGAFCEPLCNYIYNSNYYYEFKDLLYKYKVSSNEIKEFGRKHNFEKRILWNFYLNERMDVVHKILLNYFKAVKKVYEVEWDDDNSIMLKTIGYNAFILLFDDVFAFCKKNSNNFSYQFIYELLNKSKIDSNYFYTKKDASLGKLGAVSLYKELRKNISDDNMNYDNIEHIVDDIDSYSI